MAARRKDTGRLINLAVHKNKIENRNKRTRSKEASGRVEKIVREADIRAYAFVGIGADGKGYAAWDTGAIMPMWSFAPTINAILETDMVDSLDTEDWVPPLTNK